MSSLQGLNTLRDSLFYPWKFAEEGQPNSSSQFTASFSNSRKNPFWASSSLCSQFTSPLPSSPSIPSRLHEKVRRSKISAAFSTIGSSSRASTVNTAYKRVADCLIFPPFTSWRKPRALIHVIGGAFIGAVPEVTYSMFIELLRQQGFLIIATPYNVTFEHTLAAELVQQKFQRGRQALINGDFLLPGVGLDDISRLPVFSIGHSNGALLQLLIGCIYQEDLPKANAVIAFNNKPAADAVPYFEQLGPVTAQIGPIIAASPLWNISRSFSGETLKKFLGTASPILPQYDEESLQSIQNFADQIPLVLDQVSKGVSEFTPAPLENRNTIGNDYCVQNTLLVKYKVDAIDESDILEDILKPRIEKIEGNLTKITIDGNHITPCVQDIMWQTGKVYTPVDAVGQLLRNIALSEIRDTVSSISSWFENFL